MVSRPSLDTLESLRITLQKLESGLDSMQDATAMAELKLSILLRIAELEAANTLQHDEVSVPRTDDAAYLRSHQPGVLRSRESQVNH
jgi:hypothetical protein